MSPVTRVFVLLLGWIRLQPLAEVAEQPRHQIDGDDDQDDDE